MGVCVCEGVRECERLWVWCGCAVVGKKTGENVYFAWCLKQIIKEHTGQRKKVSQHSSRMLAKLYLPLNISFLQYLFLQKREYNR